MIAKSGKGKIALARELGISASSLYYRKKLPKKDQELRIRIEEAWRYHPSYGHRRLAIHLEVNKKRIRRVMKVFDLHPYRRRGKKPRKSSRISGLGYPNLTKGIPPQYEGHIWAADFTYLSYKGQFLYLATVTDLFTRKIIGWSAMRNHSSSLVLQALFMALSNYLPGQQYFIRITGENMLPGYLPRFCWKPAFKYPAPLRLLLGKMVIRSPFMPSSRLTSEILTAFIH